jgi:hypothetical protein
LAAHQAAAVVCAVCDCRRADVSLEDTVDDIDGQTVQIGMATGLAEGSSSGVYPRSGNDARLNRLRQIRAMAAHFTNGREAGIERGPQV